MFFCKLRVTSSVVNPSDADLNWRDELDEIIAAQAQAKGLEIYSEGDFIGFSNLSGADLAWVLDLAGVHRRCQPIGGGRRYTTFAQVHVEVTNDDHVRSYTNAPYVWVTDLRTGWGTDDFEGIKAGKRSIPPSYAR